MLYSCTHMVTVGVKWLTQPVWQLIGGESFDLPGNILSGDRAAVVRLVCVFEKDLDAQYAVWTQVVHHVVDLDVFWQNELLAQLTPSHLVARDTDLRLVVSCYFQQPTVHVHLCPE